MSVSYFTWKEDKNFPVSDIEYDMATRKVMVEARDEAHADDLSTFFDEYALGRVTTKGNTFFLQETNPLTVISALTTHHMVSQDLYDLAYKEFYEEMMRATPNHNVNNHAR